MVKDQENDKEAWYVIQTHSRHEDSVEISLQRKGLQIFLPRVTIPSRRRDRKVLLNPPLFPGYLFINTQLDFDTYHKIIKVRHVLRLLGNGGPTPISPEEVESVKGIVLGDKPYYPWRYPGKGDKVRVIDGPLAGVVGVIIEQRTQKRRLVVSVELFQRSVAVELDDDAVEKYS